MRDVLRYGDVVRYKLASRTLHLVVHPDDAKHVLQENAANYTKGRGIDKMRRFLGDGLLTSEGDLWRRQRKLAQPAFHHKRLQQLVGAMTESTAHTLNRWDAFARAGTTVNVAADLLPRELARLHAYGMGFEDEWALAPYAIDDATDLLYEHRVPPRDALWLAADNLNALVWGLHDWAHFHNHGPFEERAWTELQCDAAALAWLWINRAIVGIDDARWERARREVEAIGRGRFEAEGKTYDAKALDSSRVRELAKHAMGAEADHGDGTRRS
jgi:hypothetical protein